MSLAARKWRYKLSSEMTAEELAHRRALRNKSYHKHKAHNRALCRERYRRAMARNPEKLREQWRRSKKKRWATQRDKMVAYSRSLHARRKDDPAYKALKCRQARKWYIKRSTQDPTYFRRLCQEYYARHKDRILARHKERYYAKKVERILGDLDVQVDFMCEKGCGRETLHPSGTCIQCRKVTCRKCDRVLVQKYLGQRVHDACLPRE